MENEKKRENSIRLERILSEQKGKGEKGGEKTREEEREEEETDCGYHFGDLNSQLSRRLHIKTTSMAMMKMIHVV